MKTLHWMALALALVACSKSSDDMKAEIAKQQERSATPTPEVDKPAETKKVDGAGEPEKKKEEIPEPDPNKQEEVDAARKEAMRLGRYKDVIRFCEMGKAVTEKADPQARLGCALAACNLKEADKAKMWTKGLEKALLDQALKVCTPAGVTL